MRVVVALVVAAMTTAAIFLFLWLRSRRTITRSLPPLLYPMSARSPHESLGAAHPHAGEAGHPKTVPPRVVAHRTNLSPTVSGNGVKAPSSPAVAANGSTPSASRAIDHSPVGSAETVRFIRPVDAPVQLLPGRLEVLAGEPRHHEIRFVRIPGQPLQLILGRDAGPSPQYVALSSSTVSRQHARFGYADGRWVVTNLSHTNPLVVNDDELSHSDGERTLVDGDRLELGEVVLRYHAH